MEIKITRSRESLFYPNVGPRPVTQLDLNSTLNQSEAPLRGLKRKGSPTIDHEFSDVLETTLNQLEKQDRNELK